ncbi:MAG: hypothetical protein MZV63_71120 [Marinilabiliales bacterium]|nr:hypothetical protein [Marinilabiliales bacterium]
MTCLWSHLPIYDRTQFRSENNDTLLYASSLSRDSFIALTAYRHRGSALDHRTGRRGKPAYRQERGHKLRGLSRRERRRERT